MKSGFIYVASLDYNYYAMAVLSATSLRECYPDAHITLFTHDVFVDDHAKVFDNVVTKIPAHRRAKLWALDKTPYDITFYNDVDSEIVNPKIRNVFEELNKNNLDIGFTKIENTSVLKYSYTYIDKALTVRPPYFGAVALYKKKDEVLRFMEDWWKNFVIQYENPWPYTEYDELWKKFDQFTLYKLLQNDYNIRIGTIPKAYSIEFCGVSKNKKHDNLPPINYQIPTYEFLRHNGVMYDNLMEITKHAKYLPKKPENVKSSEWFV